MTTAYDIPEDRHSVILANGQTISRADAETLGYEIKEYSELLKPAERIASAHPVHTDLVTLPPFGIVASPGTAKAMGFKVSNVTLPAPQAKATANDPARAWRTTIMQLPEAITRPAATAELLTTQSHATLTVDAARAFLRGLPAEQTEAPKPVTTTKQTDPRAARLAEIEMSMKDFSRSKGYRAGRAGQGLAVNASLAAAAADPVKLKRLTEIRADALALRIGRGESHLASEHKKLSCVLDAHDKTGAPLASLMTQMGIDAAQIIKGA